ncbi:hypothetical protein G7054_g12248 [Neopestalotiopsis clavispora]|nr:hypothetical protein G7054_g12248 [Neopestalotiopsis clavispora]
MEDSPLSILASITGILTFFAAIVGFVFVRYKVLQNGTIEMDSILATTVTVIDDTGVWLEATKDTAQNDGHLKLWNTFRRELFKTELQIVTEYHAAGLLSSSVELASEPCVALVAEFGRIPVAAALVQDTRKRVGSGQKPKSSPIAAIVVSSFDCKFVRPLRVTLDEANISTCRAAKTLLREHDVLADAVQTLLIGNNVPKSELGQLKRLVYQALSPTGPPGETQKHAPGIAGKGRPTCQERRASLLNKETQTDSDSFWCLPSQGK